jgi:hypothetical protein
LSEKPAWWTVDSKSNDYEARQRTAVVIKRSSPSILAFKDFRNREGSPSKRRSSEKGGVHATYRAPNQLAPADDVGNFDISTSRQSFKPPQSYSPPALRLLRHSATDQCIIIPPHHSGCVRNKHLSSPKLLQRSKFDVSSQLSA